MTAAECMETLSAGLTGTGVYALGALLGSLGVVRGGELGDDEDRTGHQAYELVLGDTSVSLDWLAPAAIPFLWVWKRKKQHPASTEMIRVP